MTLFRNPVERGEWWPGDRVRTGISCPEQGIDVEVVVTVRPDCRQYCQAGEQQQSCYGCRKMSVTVHAKSPLVAHLPLLNKSAHDDLISP